MSDYSLQDRKRKRLSSMKTEIKHTLYTHTYMGSICGVMDTVIENGYSNMSSNPRGDTFP